MRRRGGGAVAPKPEPERPEIREAEVDAYPEGGEAHWQMVSPILGEGRTFVALDIMDILGVNMTTADLLIAYGIKKGYCEPGDRDNYYVFKGLLVQ